MDAIVCDVLKTWVFLRNLKGPEHEILMVSGKLHKNKFQIATSSPYTGLTLHPHPGHVPAARTEHDVHDSPSLIKKDNIPTNFTSPSID
jgi:hypothetical protein